VRSIRHLKTAARSRAPPSKSPREMPLPFYRNCGQDPRASESRDSWNLGCKLR